MVEGIPEFGGYSVPEEYGAFLMDKKQRKYQPLTEQTEPTTYSAASQKQPS